MWVALLSGQIGLRWALGRAALLGVLGALALFNALIFVGGAAIRERFGCWFGSDFIAFYASGQAIISGQGARVYDLAWQAAFQSRLREGAASECINVTMPMEYFAAALTPLLPLLSLPLYPAFLAWSVFSLVVFGFALWRLAEAAAVPVWPFWLWLLGSPFFYIGLQVGQVHALLFLAATEFVLALRKDRQRAAGLWLSLLLIKPQFLPLFGFLLLWKGRWRSATYAFIGGGLFMLLSLLLVGFEGLREQFALLLHLTFETPLGALGGTAMTNWRSMAVMVAGWLGLGLREMALALALLSLATVLAAFLPWRGPSWSSLSLGERDRLLLAFVVAALLVGYDTQLHSDVLVMAPALLVLSTAPSSVVEGRIQGALLALLFGPSLLLPIVFVATLHYGVAIQVTARGVFLLLLLVLPLLALPRGVFRVRPGLLGGPSAKDRHL